ncbi:MAG: DUF192 domain-containing protein [Dehalococcoidia bacterium]
MSSISSLASLFPPDGPARDSRRIRVTVARSWWARARGLLFRPAPRRGEGMLFPGCASVHTWLMSYPIDVVYVDNAGVITKLATGVRPWRFSRGARGARHVLELGAGESVRLGLRAGERIEFDTDREGVEAERRR